MNEIVQFLSDPAVGGVASVLAILTTIWGLLKSLQAKKLSNELAQLKLQINIDAGLDQRKVTTRDRSTYVETATDVTINHGKD